MTFPNHHTLIAESFDTIMSDLWSEGAYLPEQEERWGKCTYLSLIKHLEEL